jgi:hypothetical protein
MSSPPTPPIESTPDREWAHREVSDQEHLERERAVAAGHETTDVNIRGLLWLAGVTVVGVALVQIGLLVLLSYYRTEAKQADPVLSPLATERVPPPAPHLQSTPLRDYAEFARAQEEQLHSYGWVDKQQGVARIPVSRAMELILERGLPEPAGKTAPTDEGTVSEPTGNTPEERKQ